MEMILRPLLLVAIGCHWTPRSFATGSLPDGRKRLGSAQLKRHMKKSLLARAVNWLQMQGRGLLEKHMELKRESGLGNLRLEVIGANRCR